MWANVELLSESLKPVKRAIPPKTGPHYKSLIIMILIVDDNAKMRGAIKMVIGKAAGDAMECENGAEAVRLYREHHPEWVLIDIRMDEMDGITATRRIVAENPNARIIIVTNYDDADFRRDAAEAGAFAYVTKDDLSLLNRIILDGKQ